MLEMLKGAQDFSTKLLTALVFADKSLSLAAVLASFFTYDLPPFLNTFFTGLTAPF